MARKEKKYHYIYKTTNLKTGKFYVGMHSTDNLNDGYLGSGTRLRRSIRKYGEENFKLEIIEFLPDRTILIKREKELVNEELLKDPMCMNLMCGGKGGFISAEQQRNRSAAAGKKMAEKLKTDLIFREKHRMWISKTAKKLWKNGIFKPFDWTGKKHSEETKRKIGEANKLNHSGHLNSQYGTMWITNGTENKKIKKEDKIPDGWSFGRNIKR